MQIKCTQCAADVTVQQDETFIECPYCASALFIDKRKVVFHYVIKSNFKPNEAEGNLKRWMSGNHTVKDLDIKSKIIKYNYYYFPVWYFKTQDTTGDKIFLQPATSTSVSEIKKLQVPAGSLKFYNSKDYDESEMVKPDVLYESARSWLHNSGVNTEYIKEAALVHIPFYEFQYAFNNRTYTALVESSSGQVYSNIFPAKSETPFRLLFALSIIGFFLATVLSFVIGYMIDDEYGFINGELFKVILYGLLSVPLIIMAYFIAKKV